MATSSSRKRFNAGRYLLGAFLYVLRIPALIVTICVAAYAVLTKDTNMLAIAGGCVAVTLVIFLVFIIKSANVTCRLCRAQFLRNLKCSKKSHAPKVFGSYTLPVALAILARKKRIRCPYCGEKHPYFHKD